MFEVLRISGNFNDSSEKIKASAVGKDKGVEFYRKIFEHGPLLLRYHDANSYVEINFDFRAKMVHCFAEPAKLTWEV